MGNIGRESRLLFILLFTVSDDHGKLRGNSRMLVSLLYPYDDDAPKLIGKWLDQLENEKCIVRYESEGAHYIKILNWEDHQKVDHPSKSKIPDPREVSRAEEEVSRTSTVGSEDQGSEDQGKDHSRGSRLSLELAPADWIEFCQTERPDLDPHHTFEVFRDHWIAKAGKDGVKLDWTATWRNWVRREKQQSKGKSHASHTRFERQDYYAGTDGFDVT